MNSRIPTNRELVAARQAQAPLTPKPTPAALVTPKTAAEYNKDYRLRYLDEVAPSGIAGRLIKFTKDGDYITTDDEQAIPANAEFVLLADDTQIGWLKFNGPGEAPNRVMGLLFDGFEMPPREGLGDLDPAAWEVGLDGQPQDPWTHQ